MQQRLVGRPTGEVLVDMGLLTQEQVDQAAAEQQVSHQRIGEIALSKGWVHQGRPHAGSCPAPRRQVPRPGGHPHRPGRARADLRAGRAPLLGHPGGLRRRAHACSSRWPTRPTSSPSTTCASSPASTSSRGWPATKRSSRCSASCAPSGASSPTTSRPRSAPSEDDAVVDDMRDIREQVEAAPVVKLVNGVLARAADEGASDIHFEPQARDLLIRFRHDGVLHEIMTIPKRLQAGVISRLKIMADLDIAERRIPQDGRIGLTVGGRPIDMRVASLPTVYGEKIVIRLLDRSNVMLRLEELGFSEQALNRYRAVVHQAVRRHPGHRPHRVRASRPRCTPRSTS